MVVGRMNGSEADAAKKAHTSLVTGCIWTWPRTPQTRRFTRYTVKLELSPKLLCAEVSRTRECTHCSVRARWVLKRLGDVTSKAGYLLRGFEEDVRGERRFRQHHTGSISTTAALDRKNEQCAVFTADAKTAFFNANMRDGDVVYAILSPEWRPVTQDSAVGTVVWKLQRSFDGQRSAPTRWQGCLESILTKAGFVSNQLEPSLWAHSGERTALAYHVDDRMMAGARQTAKEVLAKLSKDLDTATSEVTSKHSKDFGRTLTTPAVLESITNTLRVCLMNTTFAVLKVSAGLRWENRENDGDELPHCTECVDSWLQSCCGSTERTCDVRWRKAVRSFGRGSATDMRNIMSILRCLQGSDDGRAVAVWRSCEESMRGLRLTFRDSDWAGDSGRHSVSGTASWIRGETPFGIPSASKTQSTIHGQRWLRAAACEGMGLRQLWRFLLAF